jgi:uncharacterized protein DUF1579
MQRKWFWLVLALGLSTSGAARAESQAGKAAEQPAPAMSQEEMAKWMAHATPGEGHKVLEPLAGKWKVQAKFWFAPGAPAEESSAEAEFSWALGKRFIQQSYTSEMAGQTFTGLGFIGYDNTAKKYSSLWMDTMSTSVLVAYGSYDPAKKELTFSGEYDDPIHGVRKKMRNVLRIVSAERQEFEIYEAGPDGKESKMMEAVYTKQP